MELGGHASVLVFDDCDLDKTVAMLAGAKIRNAGQVCVSPTRFFVQQDYYERFAAGFVERKEAIAVGNGMDAGTQMGPLANPRRSGAIKALVADARAAGALVATGGERGAGRGFF